MTQQCIIITTKSKIERLSDCDWQLGNEALGIRQRDCVQDFTKLGPRKTKQNSRSIIKQNFYGNKKKASVFHKVIFYRH